MILLARRKQSALLQELSGIRRMSETPTTTTSQESIAIHLPFVLQYASNLYYSTLGATELSGEGNTSVLLPFVSQYASHLYRNTPPICTAMLLGKSWWLWSPGCSPQKPQPPVLSHKSIAIQGKKKSTNQSFWSGCPPVGGRLPHEGVGAKKFGMFLETQGNRSSGGISRAFSRDLSHPKFREGVGGHRGGWREEILHMPEIQASFLYPFSYAPFRRRGTQ